MEYFEVRNWEKFQHYKDRNPPWIKLHFEILASEDWVTLNDASRVLAIACMLVASRNEGRVPNNPEYIKRVAYLNKLPDFKPLISCGFLKKVLASASVMQASASAMQANARPETETYREDTYREDTEKNISDFENFWNEYGYKVGKLDAQKVYEKIIKKGVSHEIIINGVRRYQKHCQRIGTSGKHVKHPTTYLNGQCWNDEYPEFVIVGKSSEYAEAAARGQARAENPDF